MKHLNKLLVFLMNLVLIIGCSSNIPSSGYDSSQIISVNKPKVIYDLNRLPKIINVFLLNKKNINEAEFIKGISTNFYYFKNLNNYSPKINFITKKDLDKTACYLGSSFNNFSIIFLTDEFSKKLSQPCLNKILRLKALVVTSNGSRVFNEQDQEILYIGKEKEYEDLLKYAKAKGNLNSLIINDKNTLDKSSLNEIWTELNGKNLGSYTLDIKSDQNLLSKILLIESSEERARKLSRAISEKIESIPRRRMDIDSIIMTVSLKTARSLKPELEYNFGESISVYLFPNWQSEDFYLNKELDLDKVFLIDLPWMFSPKISYIDNLPKRKNRYFALGYDAYDISLLLNNPDSERRFEFNGLSGNLAYRKGDLRRSSLKVEIQSGKFKIIGY